MKTLTVFALALLAAGPLLAQEALIRKNLAAQVKNLPAIDEVRPSPIPGVYEVRYGGTEIFYTDAKGEHILSGSLIEAKTMTNLTEQRLDQLSAIDFAALPIADAMVIRQGSGARKMAVFVDPNCGYCKRFERDLLAVKDVTIYTFLMPILGADSTAKSRDITCAADPGKTWRAWMIDGVVPPKTAAGSKCDTSAIERNLAFGQAQRINGTPAVFFADGTRRPGALSGETIERLLAAAATAAKK